MASIFVLNKNEERNLIDVPLRARSKFCDWQKVYYVKSVIIEQYAVLEELCTMFCGDELSVEASDDESDDHLDSSATAPLQGNIIVTSYVRSVVGDDKLLLDIRKLYGTDFFYDAIQLLSSANNGLVTPERLPCNQLYLLKKARKLQSMLDLQARNSVSE